MNESVAEAWAAWERRMAGAGLALDLDGKTTDEQVRQLSALCNAALQLLYDDHVERRADRRPDLRIQHDLLPVQPAKVQKLVDSLIKAGALSPDDFWPLSWDKKKPPQQMHPERWKQFWKTNNEFHRDLIRYIFTPEVFSKVEDDWLRTHQADVQKWAKQADRTLRRRILKVENYLLDTPTIFSSIEMAAIDYCNALVSDPLRVLSASVTSLIPHYPMIRDIRRRNLAASKQGWDSLMDSILSHSTYPLQDGVRFYTDREYAERREILRSLSTLIIDLAESSLSRVSLAQTSGEADDVYFKNLRFALSGARSIWYHLEPGRVL